MSEADEAPVSATAQPVRTNPRGFLVRALTQLMQGAVPTVAAIIGSGAGALGLVAIVPAVVAVMVVSFGLAWLRWRRLTYTVGAQDIRVEKGLISLSARSVPYERIQDVSIEQKWLPRLLGLAEVKFETGAGGKDEISLAYLSLDESERLRELVRERREGAPATGTSPETPAKAEPSAELLFAMDNRRILRFGLFEFSLVIFAVLLGAAQQFDFLFPFRIWDWDSWRRLLSGSEARIAGFSHGAQFVAVGAGLAIVLLLGVLTGIARTFAREYGFRLELNVRGFRRRRGLFNKSDVLLPVHRVQAALVRTGLVRRRFGWHALDFVSLAQDDAKSGHHTMVPFARMDEIWPVVRAAGVEPPTESIAWHRPSPRPWLYDTIFHGVFFAVLGTVVSVVLASPWPLVAGVMAIAGTALLNWLGWRRHVHAMDETQLFVRSGRLAPRLELAPTVKLQSAEIAQSPLGRWRGYATLRLGLAGGRLELFGLPLAEAQAMREAIVERIASVDFSRLPG